MFRISGRFFEKNLVPQNNTNSIFRKFFIKNALKYDLCGSGRTKHSAKFWGTPQNTSGYYPHLIGASYCGIRQKLPNTKIGLQNFSIWQHKSNRNISGETRVPGGPTRAEARRNYWEETKPKFFLQKQGFKCISFGISCCFTLWNDKWHRRSLFRNNRKNGILSQFCATLTVFLENFPSILGGTKVA